MIDKRREPQQATGLVKPIRLQQLAAFSHDRLLRYERLEDRFLLAADFGDAPTPYSTLLADNGPRHEAVGPTLGSVRDTELDGLPTEMAQGDDLSALADEDGISFGQLRVGQLDAAVQVVVSNTLTGAKLDAWIDFDRDGSWSGADEKIATSMSLGPGEHTISFDIPSTAASGPTFARFRGSTAGGLGPTGPAADGEVEDYRITLLPPVASGGQFGLPHVIASDVNEQSLNTAGTIGVSAADLDNDGDMDVIASAALDGILSWYENQGVLGFERHEIAADLPWVNEIVPTDLDQDGDLDLVTVAARDGYSLAWHENDGEENFQTHCLAVSETDGARALDVVDIDIDGDLDIVVARDYVVMYNGSAEVTLYRNTGNQFVAEVLATSGMDGQSLDAADIDRDGDIDIVETVWSTRGVNLLRQQDGVFTRESLVTTPGYGNLAVAAQLDNAEGLDILVNSWSDGENFWLMNNGTSFQRYGLPDFGNESGALWSADMNGDGRMDALLGSQRTVIWTNVLGNQEFGEANLVSPTETPVDFFPADMDGDGDLDVIVAAGEEDGIAWYENTDYRISREMGGWIPTIGEDGHNAIYGGIGYLRYGSREEELTITLSLGGAAACGIDYILEGVTNVTATTAQLTFPAGANFASMTIKTLQDPEYELDEIINIQVIDGSNYRSSLADPQSVIIADDDPADFGDAPAPYPTARASNGAKHGAYGPQLGSSRDVELDGPPAAAMDGDNSVGSADEDGVAWGTIRVGQLDAEMTVDVQNVTGTAFVDAWIDFNGDGNWGGLGEQILARALVANGANVLKFDVPSTAFAGTTYTRVRISSVGSLSYLGATLDGEVEDYEVTLVPPAPSLGRFVAHDIADIDFDYTHSAYPADIDNDGDMDIIATSRAGLIWHENMGDGSFTARSLSTAEENPRFVQVMDFDRDGDSDILTIEADPDPEWLGNWIAIHENLGGGAFDVRGLVRIYSQEWMSAQDINLDGDTDFLINNGYYDNQDGTFEFRQLSYVDAAMHHALDFDGDGDLDLVSADLYDDLRYNSPDIGGFGWQENTGGLYFNRHRVSAENASWVSAGDVDLDGDMDLIAARRQDEGLAWYENNGSNSFATHEIAPWQRGRGYRFTLGDIEGDGDLDVIALANEYASIWTYRNDGEGNFIEEPLMQSIDQVYALAMADMDGDGDLDLISGQSWGGDYFGNLSWHENVRAAVTMETVAGVIGENGASTGRIVFHRTGSVDEGLAVNFALAGGAAYPRDYSLAGAATLAGGAGTVHFPAGRDTVELIVTAVSDSELESNETVQIGLLPGPDYLVDSQLASVVHIVDDEAGDFGDAPGRYPTLLAKDGARHGASGPMLGTQRDSEANGQPTDQANGDNLPADGEDGIQFGSLQVGQFGGSVTVSMSGRSTGRLDAWIDFDGDGSWSGAQEQIADSQLILSGANAITFDVPATAKSGVTYARFRVSTAGGLGPIGAAYDGEVEDVAVAIRPPSMTVPKFEGTALLNFGTSLDQVLTADLDGDGDLDAIGTNSYRDEIYWYENLSPLQFERHAITVDASNLRRLVAGDIDGDSDIDILSPGSYAIEWYRNNGAGDFTLTLIGAEDVVGSNSNAIEIVDLDSDGDLDLLAGGGLAWYENDRNVFEYHVIDSLGANSVVAADFDCDGDIDIVAGVGGIDQELRLYRNDGTQQFTATTLDYGYNGFQSLIATDLSHDGYADILFFHPRNGNHEFGWLQNDGEGGFLKRTISETSLSYGTPAIADIDGDGDQDLLVPVYSYNRLLLFANRGGGIFELTALDPNAAGIQSVTAGDFDGDGDLDLLTGRANTKPMVYYENQNLFDSGDFDGDGDVDGRDFLIWQRGGSPSALSSSDLTDWQNNYDVTEASHSGDFDFDTDVDGRDFLAWQRNPNFGALSDWQSNYGTPAIAPIIASVSSNDTDGSTGSKLGWSQSESLIAVAGNFEILPRYSRRTVASKAWLAHGQDLLTPKSQRDILAEELQYAELSDDQIFDRFFPTHNVTALDDLLSVYRDGDDSAYDSIYAEWNDDLIRLLSNNWLHNFKKF